MKKNRTPIMVLPTRGRTPKKVAALERTVFGPKKYGVESVFIRLTKTTGIKLFPTFSAAEFSHRHQKRAAKHGFGPKVLSSIFTCVQANGAELVNPDNDEVCTYAYLTEVAQMKGYVTEEADEALDRAAKKIGWSIGDLHDGNVGYLRGKPVLVDFGYYTF